MGRRQYIGARYVPKYFDWNGSPEWRSGVAYEALTIVARNGYNYTSKIPVPSNIGAPEDNPEYWVVTGMSNEQIESLRQDLTTAQGDITELKEDLNEITGNSAIPYTINGYYNTSTVGNIVDFDTPSLSPNFKSAVIACGEGDTFTVNGIGGANGRLWAFLDNTKKVTRRETNNYEINNKVIKAASGETYLIVCNNINTLPNAKSYYGEIIRASVENLKTNSADKAELKSLESAFYGLQNEQVPIMLIKDSYVTNAGAIEPYAGWDCTVYIPVTGYKTIRVKSSVQSGYNVFTDANKNKVGNNFTVRTDYSDVNVPSNAIYVVMSNTAEGMANLEASFEKYPVMESKRPTVQTAFSQLVDMGVYNIERSVLNAITDKPSDADDAVATLINYSGAYANGNYTIQRLYQLSGKAWERLIYSPTGEVSLNWSRIDLSADTSNYLKGKKLVTAGDSYTAASWAWSDEYKEYDGKNFGYYIAQRNGMSFVNAGISGSTMAIPTNGVGHNPFVVDRYLNIPADADYLTLWFGINDAANCTLGTIDDEVDNTFYGAWNKVLRYYLTNRPWLKILIVVTTGAIGWDGDTRLDFRQAIRNVAEKWGYPYLDWEKDKAIPAFFDREGMSTEAQTLRRDAFGYNGPNEGHPNPQWYEYESTIIEAKLRSI